LRIGSTERGDGRGSHRAVAARRHRNSGLGIGIALAAALALAGCAATEGTSAGEGGASFGNGGSAHSTPVATYGGLPSFLPKTSTQPDSQLVGSVKRPALTVEGDAVRVEINDASVKATVVGPEVPGEGLPYQAPTTTCTWTVTLSGASQTMPITISDFSTIDHLGVVYHPALVPGQPAPPAMLEPGKSVTFELRAVMGVGEGLMRWAPGGVHILASWDFEVEND
jgi:hypothetical protein